MRVLTSVLMVVCLAAFSAGCITTVNPEATRYLHAADAAFRQGDDPSAIEAGSRFIQMHPRLEESGEAYYIRGLARCRSGQVNAGKTDLQTALTLTKRKDLLALVHCRLGDIAYQADEMTESEKHYRQAVKYVRPGAPPADEAMYRLGCILQREGRWREADLFFSRMVHFFDGEPLAERATEHAHAVRWSIQAAAMSKVAAAKQLKNRLERAGLDARTDLELRNGRVMRLVRVGSYHTYGQAQADLGKVRTIVTDAYITSAR
ncbi:MAG: SPOR domain-containing protein [Planctomycetota bacterium]|nr:SPOR domain-containing protein [Planctomycetota bacterium]